MFSNKSSGKNLALYLTLNLTSLRHALFDFDSRAPLRSYSNSGFTFEINKAKKTKKAKIVPMKKHNSRNVYREQLFLNFFKKITIDWPN